ncbi:MAG: DUF488 domain-containing protein [Oscillospiraceae bacterium]|nr:DUF488 domain-containing protein [Oscillospiraceae bacterium]
MIIYTMGFAQKSAEEFFSLISDNHIELLLDIRLNNKSQLAGFTKGNDLEFFLREICKCAYEHNVEYAPTKEILTDYKNKEIDWDEYEKRYVALMNERGSYQSFENNFSPYKKIALLCSEPSAAQCHRRLLAELIQGLSTDIQIRHL